MIIITGVAGSGKSSQGKRLAKEKNMAWISTGEYLRSHLPVERQEEMLKGSLISDDEVKAVIKKAFRELENPELAILDGFPRTLDQTEWLLREHESGETMITKVIHLVADEEIVKKRLLKRGRKDDNLQAIHKRFTEYNETILPILELFKKHEVEVVDVDAMQEIDEVFKDVLKAVES